MKNIGPSADSQAKPKKYIDIKVMPCEKNRLEIIDFRP